MLECIYEEKKIFQINANTFERRMGMILVDPSLIKRIDEYAIRALGIPAEELMLRSGRAVASQIRANVALGGTVRIFAGKGNNGGDGYAAACLLMNDYDVIVYDVFSSGQRTEEGKHFLTLFASSGGRVEPLTLDTDQLSDVSHSDCIVDAVFGTGFTSDLPKIAIKLANTFAHLDKPFKLAVDVPLGVNASDGSVIDNATYHAHSTITLGFIKTGLVSYPAKEYVGKLVYENIGLQISDFRSIIDSDTHLVDSDLAASLVPHRKENSSKGTFGKLLLITGSPRFPGAAHLSLEAALRGGAGYVTFIGDEETCASLLPSFPEAIYRKFPMAHLTPKDAQEIVSIAHNHTAVLFGSGSTVNASFLPLLEALLTTDGCPLILDADAINLLSLDSEKGRALIRNSPRKVILTPHPLELSRLCGLSVDEIQANRLSVAKRFASENNCILLLKGAATIVTDGITTYVNSSGSSALAKAGSGDVLSGFLASVVGSGVDPIDGAALSAYFHGIAGDALAGELSLLGVTPSDLAREIARQIAGAIQSKQ